MEMQEMKESPKEEFAKHLDSFFDALKFRDEVFQLHKRETDRHLATDFNVFTYILHDELNLSHIIADLLNPEGGHGQGTVFLNVFLEILRSAEAAEADLPRQALVSLLKGPINDVRVDVSRERPTDSIESSQRRIDIVLTINGAALAIENKPWADDQDGQIEEYSRHLEKKYKKKYVIVYLSGDGLSPATSSLSPTRRRELLRTGHYFEISYPKEFRNWLESCGKECEAEKVRSFLRDFADYVVQDFHLAVQEVKDE
jgi:hypothetical protein